MLDGLIYLDRITDNRMTGSPYKNLRMFERLCGDAELNQVILVSTMWEKVRHATGEAREQELVNKFWKVLIDKGSRVNRLEKNTTNLAWTIVDQLIQDREGKEALLLQSWKRLGISSKSVQMTVAWPFLNHSRISLQLRERSLVHSKKWG